MQEHAHGSIRNDVSHTKSNVYHKYCILSIINCHCFIASCMLLYHLQRHTIIGTLTKLINPVSVGHHFENMATLSCKSYTTIL